jgi:hypothetical protein
VVDVLAAALARQHVDDRRRRDAHGRERHLAAAPLVDADGFEAEPADVEVE